jgi:chemotaxis protein methyltransferase CheR
MHAKVKIDPNEFQLMRDYIEDSCGIHITQDKMYLVETRLTTLMVENGCKNFRELYKKASSDITKKLRDKIIDAMTTNETLWFRDKNPFIILDDVLLKQFANDLHSKKKSKIKIWSAACSTGQEPYSIAMTILEYIKRDPKLRPEQFEITATDISPTVLYLAMAGRYDNLAISRGLTESLKFKYFEPNGKVWVLKNEVKKMVTFKKLNLQENINSLGKQDLIFCRNVLIYFSDEFKKEVLHRLGELLRPDGYLFLGASESIIAYSKEYQMQKHTKGLYYKIEKNTAVEY